MSAKKKSAIKPTKPRAGGGKSTLNVKVSHAGDAHSWSVVPGKVSPRGDPIITITAPPSGSNESIAGGAFTAQGTVTPTTATVTVRIRQSDGTSVDGNPLHPVPDSAGNWSTQFNTAANPLTRTGSALLGAGATAGIAQAGASEGLNITA